MTQSTGEKNGMNVNMSDTERAYREHDAASEQQRHGLARRVGIETLERELHGETTDAVDISIYVRGRMVATTTDSATVARIMAILTGLEQ